MARIPSVRGRHAVTDLRGTDGTMRPAAITTISGGYAALCGPRICSRERAVPGRQTAPPMVASDRGFGDLTDSRPRLAAWRQRLDALSSLRATTARSQPRRGLAQRVRFGSAADRVRARAYTV